MEDRQRVGIGTVVMRNQQYLGAVRPLDGALALSTMRFADEVAPRADASGLPEKRSKPDAKEMKLAGQISAARKPAATKTSSKKKKKKKKKASTKTSSAKGSGSSGSTRKSA